ncbi:hypothetical protein SAMN02745123_03470 [Desulforamulus aeronauticus DSM 10349]|uniref:Uncharacterized protein n=1 Tax=Desulforamulus aeronauticus DSM 10349 TaxID=1121421 RepID=A0A1M6W4L0_9FIRM|nr:hypothetical protein SAMN02745123_03470 [Desulforamulus aeronauticus DSM 10349]
MPMDVDIARFSSQTLTELFLGVVVQLLLNIDYMGLRVGFH